MLTGSAKELVLANVKAPPVAVRATAGVNPCLFPPAQVAPPDGRLAVRRQLRKALCADEGERQLMRTWCQISRLTPQSTQPCLVPASTPNAFELMFARLIRQKGFYLRQLGDLAASLDGYTVLGPPPLFLSIRNSLPTSEDPEGLTKLMRLLKPARATFKFGSVLSLIRLTII